MKKSIPHPSVLVRVGAIASAVVLGSCLAAGTAFADTAADAASTLVLPELLQPGLHTDYESADSAELATAYPSAFDLRHYNGTVTYNAGDKQSTITGGINYVTPVKLQNPFGSCWAFACTAASETSMISTLDATDDGEMNGTVDYEKAASGAAGDIAYEVSNLSERHLAYFAFAHPARYGMFSSQAGEGMYLYSEASDAATMMDSGGMLLLGMSVYSTGIGPVAESVAPYISDEGWIQVPTTHDRVNGDFVYKYFTSYDKAKAYMDATWTDEAISAFNAANDTHITRQSVVPRIASKGTWAVDNDRKYYVTAELSNSNIIASNKNKDGSLTADEMAQMKRELSEGHPLSIAYASDQSRPGDTISSAHSYINTATWAQYTYDTKKVNHAVTIVGYDDNYDASNFTHNVYKQDENGDWVIDEENTARTTPAGNGAWIVKNSWGSTDSEDPLDYMEWGINGTGYFYLSYYDLNISNMESFEYDLSEEAQTREGYYSYQYDMANVSYVSSAATEEPYQMVNVFDGPDEGENSVVIRDLGCQTGAPNATTTLEVYVMDGDADVAATVDATQPAATVAQTYDSAGFHRMHLDGGVVVSPGQKFAIVQTSQRADGTYEHTFDYGPSQTFANAVNGAYSPLEITAIGSYCLTVVNEGESLAKVDGSWKDWTELIPAVDQAAAEKNIKDMRGSADNYYKLAIAAQMRGSQDAYKMYMTVYNNLKSFDCSSAIAIDNWTIKAYADEIEVPTAEPATAVNAWGQLATFSCHVNSVTADGFRWQWSKDGETWKDCTIGAGMDSASYTLPATKYRAGYVYRCVVTSGADEYVTSGVSFDLQILQAEATSTPATKIGAKAQLACVCSVNGATYQWQYRKSETSSWKNCTTKTCSDPTAAKIKVKAASYRSDYQYRCVVTAPDGTVLLTNSVELL